MLGAYYPENKDLQKAKSILVDALHKGVHRAALPGGIHTGIMATVAREIRFAKDNTRPAAGKIFDRKNSVGGGIGDPLIPYDEWCAVFTSQGWELDPECVKRNKIKEILNDGLEKSGHHILYEFIANPNSQPQTVAYKALNHRAVNATLSQISEIENSTLKTWVRNGIIRYNIARGAGALQPEATIQGLKENAGKGVGIAPAVLVAIIGAIAAAITATAQLVAAVKQADPQTTALWNQFQGIGTGVFGPEVPDWQGTGGGNGSAPGETDFLPLLLMAGAGLLLID